MRARKNNTSIRRGRKNSSIGKIALWATISSLVYIVFYHALGFDNPQKAETPDIELKSNRPVKPIDIRNYQRDYGMFDNRNPFSQYTFGTYAEFFNDLSNKYTSGKTSEHSATVTRENLMGNVSTWNPDALRAFMNRANVYQSLMDPSVGVFTEGNSSFPSTITFIDKIYGKHEVIGQLIVSKPFEDNSPKYARAYMETFRQALIKQGYTMTDVNTFAKTPLQGAGFDSNNLYTAEKQQAYELIFEKDVGVVSQGKYPLEGTDRVILTLNPEMSHDKLGYKTLSIFYTRQKYHN